MKKIILTFLLLTCYNLFSQIITENVSFDNSISSTNNDLSNNFIFPAGALTNFITQSDIGGINGGALIPPNTINWGNDIIQYCSTYRNTINSMIETSICFKYNSTLVNPNTSERSIAIWMYGDSTNHNVCFHLDNAGTNMKSIVITGYNYSQNQPPSITLVNGHWYKLVGQYKSIGGNFGDAVSVKAEVFDLGINGLSSPVNIGNHTATIYDLNLVSSSKYILGISAAKWGGADYLDNFVFKGEKKGSLCSSLITNENIMEENNFILYPNPANEFINLSTTSNFEKSIFKINDLTGKTILNGNITRENMLIDISELQSGLYFITVINDEKENNTFKFIKN